MWMMMMWWSTYWLRPPFFCAFGLEWEIKTITTLCWFNKLSKRKLRQSLSLPLIMSWGLMLEAVSMFFNCNTGTSTNTINCQCLCDHYNMHNSDYVHRVALLLWSVGAVMCRSNFFGLALLLAAQYERIFRSAIQQIIKYDQLKFKLGDNMRALMTMTAKRSGAALAPQRWSSVTEN